jgi:Rieske Fe-S protein
MSEETGSKTTESMTRRDMLKEALKGTLTAAAGIALLPMLTDRAGAAEDKWTVVGKATDFVKNTPQRVAVADGVLYITRAEDASLSAVSAKCTHRGCEIGWVAADTQFECPCHGAAFTVIGKNIHGTRRKPDEALPPLASVPVREKNKMVEVNLGAVTSADIQPNVN